LRTRKRGVDDQVTIRDQQRVLALVALARHDERLDEAVPDRGAAIDGHVRGHAEFGRARFDGRAFFRVDAAGVGEHGVHVPAPFLQVGDAEGSVEAAGEGQHDVLGCHGGSSVRFESGHQRRWPASVAITAFCTCRRFSASSIAMQRGESITASVAFTLRRSGRQCENTPSLVSAILASSTMKCLCASRMGFSGAQLPKYGSAPQLLAYTTSAPAYALSMSWLTCSEPPLSATFCAAQPM